jgi:hypothetical protein
MDVDPSEMPAVSAVRAAHGRRGNDAGAPTARLAADDAHPAVSRGRDPDFDSRAEARAAAGVWEDADVSKLREWRNKHRLANTTPPDEIEILQLVAYPSEAMVNAEARVDETFASLPFSERAREMLKAGLIGLVDGIEDLTPAETRALRERVMAKAMSSAGRKMGEEALKKRGR